MFILFYGFAKMALKLLLSSMKASVIGYWLKKTFNLFRLCLIEINSQQIVMITEILKEF